MVLTGFYAEKFSPVSDNRIPEISMAPATDMVVNPKNFFINAPPLYEIVAIILGKMGKSIHFSSFVIIFLL